MSTNPQDQNDDGDGDDSPQVTIPRSNIRQLEKAAKAGAEAQVELAAVRRELAFRDAGIDPTVPQAKYFMKGYDGEVTVEAIRAEAATIGLIGQQSTAPPPNPQQIPPAELLLLSQSNATTAGFQSAPPSATSEAAYFAAMQAAKNPDEVMDAVRRFGLPTPGMD